MPFAYGLMVALKLGRGDDEAMEEVILDARLAAD